MQTAFIISSAIAIRDAIAAHEPDIESLDRAIGDGDHYINIKRASETIANMADALTDLSPDAALQQIGTKLLSTIGGASGVLFASFFTAMAKVAQQNGANTPLEIAAAFAAGVQNIMQRGKATAGEKTMLDVLIPASTSFTLAAAANKTSPQICQEIIAAANTGLENTRNILATKGRAASLGERAIGHLDPGAKSCQVMLHAVCGLILAK